MNNSLICAKRTLCPSDSMYGDCVEDLSLAITLPEPVSGADSVSVRCFSDNYRFLGADSCQVVPQSRRRKYVFHLPHVRHASDEALTVVVCTDDEPRWQYRLPLVGDQEYPTRSQLSAFNADSFLPCVARRLWQCSSWRHLSYLDAGRPFAERLARLLMHMDCEHPLAVLLVASATNARILATEVVGLFAADEEPQCVRHTSLSRHASGEDNFEELLTDEPLAKAIAVGLDVSEVKGDLEVAFDQMVDDLVLYWSTGQTLVFYCSPDSLDAVRRYFPPLIRDVRDDLIVTMPDTPDEDDDFMERLTRFLEGQKVNVREEQAAGGEPQEKAPVKIPAEERLRRMVGLDRVKDEVRMARLMALFAKERRDMGIGTDDESRNHMLFYGNPGTGKTTVAKLIGEMYHDMGLLSRGHTVEVDRGKLVGEYIGETEKKVEKYIEEARGGVLFVDEAYTLASGNDGKDYGRQVVNALLTVLSEPQPDLIVIFAGYEDKMQRLLELNPGLMDRFPLKLHFEDYSAEQLFQIAADLLRRMHYELSDRASDRLLEVMEEAARQRDCYFGNGRWVHNLVEHGIVRALVSRVMALPAEEHSAHLLSTVETSDVDEAAQQFLDMAQRRRAQRRPIGFAV